MIIRWPSLDWWQDFCFLNVYKKNFWSSKKPDVIKKTSQTWCLLPRKPPGLVKPGVIKKPATSGCFDTRIPSGRTRTRKPAFRRSLSIPSPSWSCSSTTTSRCTSRRCSRVCSSKWRSLSRCSLLNARRDRDQYIVSCNHLVTRFDLFCLGKYTDLLFWLIWPLC